MATFSASVQTPNSQSAHSATNCVDTTATSSGQTLFQQAVQSPQPEALVKKQFAKQTPAQRTQSANRFVKAAGRDGLNRLAETPAGQHALAVVYGQTSGESRQFMEDVHKEQGGTAVNYTRPNHKNLSPRATMLFEAINGGVFGLGTDKPKLFQALRNLNPAEYNELQRVYRDHHPGRDLTADIKGDLSGNDLKRAECLMRGETLRADAIGLREAMRGAGTNESEIHAILAGQTLSPQQLKAAYQREFQRDLAADLKSELSGSDLNQAEAALRGERSEPQKREQKSPLEDAKQLYKAMDGIGTNEARIHSILNGRTSEEINKIREAYRAHTHGRDLDTDLRSELSGRDLFQAQMSLRGRATTIEESLSRMNERYEYERGGSSNGIGRFVTDTFSDKGALLDNNHQRANSYYRQAMSDGKLDLGERARLGQLVGYANDDVGSYQNAKESVADTAGTVAATAVATAVVVGTAGTGTPLAATLLMAAGGGAAARAATTGAIEGESYGIEDFASDAGVGAVDGLATVTGMKAGTAVAQSALRSTATSALRNEGLQITERTVAHMSQELLSSSTKARVAFGALEGSVDGAIGGALGEGGTTAVSDGTWDQGLTAGLERISTNSAFGGGFGGLGGALGGGVFGRKSTHLADDMVDTLPLAKTGGRGGINEREFARSGISLKQAENMRQALLARADTTNVQNNLRSLGVNADREMIETVKQYSFDSPGIVFDPKSHDAWSRLSSGQGTPQDAAYFVHEVAEINTLKEQGIDCLGRDFSTMTESQQKQWKSGFDQAYDTAHQQGIKAENSFFSQTHVEGKDLSQDVGVKRTGPASADDVRASTLREESVGSNTGFTDKSVFNEFPERTTLNTSGIDQQAQFLSKYIPELTPQQAKSILEQGFSRDSTVVLGGSRVRGDFTSTSDIDVGFGGLSERQAQRIIGKLNKQVGALNLRLEELTIVPGKRTDTIDTIVSPEEFFQRSGVRAGRDKRAGEQFFPSGSITLVPGGKILILPPGVKP